MEFVIGATAACGACIFSNPMDVLKTRMQLQGELKARGQYTIIYRNIIHAGIAVAKVSCWSRILTLYDYVFDSVNRISLSVKKLDKFWIFLFRLMCLSDFTLFVM